jgi:hypothetical protein
VSSKSPRGSKTQRTSVYLNCCSTSYIVVRHVSHVNVPETNSGRTSLVRVTVPLILINCPIRSIRRSRIPDVMGRLYIAM